MSIHFMSILTSQLFFFILLGMLYGAHAIWKMPYTRRDIQFILCCNCLLLLRIIMPVEFPFTRTIHLHNILPGIYRFLIYKFELFSLSISIMNLLLCLWIAGVLHAGFLFIRRYRDFHRILYYTAPIESPQVTSILEEIVKKHRSQVDFKVVTMEEIVSPMITGLFHPTIILPDIRFSDDELRYVLNHETEHYYHHDLWLSALLKFLSILYWWNPVCRYIQKNITASLELHNDMITTAGLSAEKRFQYLECLYKVAKYGEDSPSSILLYFANLQKRLAKERFQLLTSDKPPKKEIFIHNLIHVVILLLILVSFTVVLEPMAPPRDAPETFSKNFDNLYLVKNKDEFDLYVNGRYNVTIPYVLDDFKSLPIYNSKEEVPHEIQKN